MILILIFLDNIIYKQLKMIKKYIFKILFNMNQMYKNY